MHVGDFYLAQTDKTRVIYHIPTGNICKVSDEIFDDFKNGDCRNEKTFELISNLNKSPLIEPELIESKSELLGNLLFISSENCNLRCKYCFVDQGKYNGKTKTKNMSLDTYLDSVNYALKIYPKGIKNICFFGGEPLLNFDVIKKFVLKYETEILNKKKEIYPTKFSIITNGALADKEVIDFFEEHNFIVTLSLDGPKDINDAARLMANGKSSYDAVFNNLDLWVNGNFNLSIEATVNNYHIKNYKRGIVADWINNFRRLNFHIMAMYVVVTKDIDTKISDNTVLKNIFNEIVDYWFDQIINNENLNCADAFVIGMINNILLKKYKLSCSVHNSLAVDPYGQVYPCQLFCQSGSYCMGTIYDKEHENREKVIEKIMATDRKDVENCQKCWIGNFCSVWCKGNSQNFCSNILSTVDMQCLQAKIVAERIIYNLALLITDNDRMKIFAKNFNALKNALNLNKEELAYEI